MKTEIINKIQDLILVETITSTGTDNEELDIKYLENKYKIPFSSDRIVWIKTIFGDLYEIKQLTKK